MAITDRGGDRHIALRLPAGKWLATDDTFARWRDTFDYAYDNHPGGILTHTVHGLVSGRAHAIMLLERFVVHMKQHDDVWFATLSDIYDCWRDD